MKKAFILYNFSHAKQLAFTALFAALCCVCTILINVPLPASGYFNTGDIFVLLSAWCLGPLYGSIAAAVGSALADIIVGAAIYAPATFLIKGIDALIAYLVWSFLTKRINKGRFDFLFRIISATLGEMWMALGYFLYEGIFLSTFTAALPNIFGNVLQGICCLLCAVLLLSVLRPIKAVQKFFPLLHQENRT